MNPNNPFTRLGSRLPVRLVDITGVDFDGASNEYRVEFSVYDRGLLPKVIANNQPGNLLEVSGKRLVITAIEGEPRLDAERCCHVLRVVAIDVGMALRKLSAASKSSEPTAPDKVRTGLPISSLFKTPTRKILK